MPQTLAVTDAVTTINQAETRFDLHRTTDPEFFSGWVETLPELTAQEQQTCDIQAEVSVKIEVADGDTTLQGRIDTLVLQNRLWIVVVESKRTTFPCPDAILQALEH